MTLTSEQWEAMSVSNRKKLLAQMKLSSTWATRRFDPHYHGDSGALPDFVRKDLYAVTSGTHYGWKKKGKK